MTDEMLSRSPIDSHDPLLNRNLYPAAYRLQGPIVPVCIFLGAAGIACGIFGLRFAFSPLFEQGKFPDPFMLSSAVAFVALTVGGGWLITVLFKFRMVVCENSIEEQYLFRTKRFSRSDIAGKRIYPRGGGVLIKTVVIYPINRDSTVMKIEMHFRNTKEFD